MSDYVMLISTCSFEENASAMTFLTPLLANERNIGKRPRKDLAHLILREVFGNALQKPNSAIVAVLGTYV